MYFTKRVDGFNARSLKGRKNEVRIVLLSSCYPKVIEV